MKIDINIFDLDSIDKAINQINQYAKDFENKTAECKTKIADKCLEYSRANFDNSWVDDIVTTGSENDYAFSSHSPIVTCSVEEHEGQVTLTASGYDAVWVEFGAGIHYNLSVGDSPHEWGAELGMLIGEYGKKQGRNHMWLSPNGVSRGTKAQMPLYNACVQTEEDAYEVIKEVFKE